MATENIDFRLYNAAGTLTNADSTPVLSDSLGAFGIKNASTGVIVIADGTAMTAVATGHYRYQLTVADTEDASADTGAYGSTYTCAVEYVYLDNTHYVESNKLIPPAESSRGHAAWVADQVESYLGGTPAAGVALGCVKTGYDEFLAGMNPANGLKHTWSFLKRYSEITLTASVEGTATGVYTASATGRQLGTIAVTATTAMRMETGMGRPSVVEQVMAMRAPYVTNSPWEKLTMPVALWIRVNPRAIMP